MAEIDPRELSGLLESAAAYIKKQATKYKVFPDYV
jgi:hypothetical protein